MKKGVDIRKARWYIGQARERAAVIDGAAQKKVLWKLKFFLDKALSPWYYRQAVTPQREAAGVYLEN